MKAYIHTPIDETKFRVVYRLIQLPPKIHRGAHGAQVKRSNLDELASLYRHCLSTDSASHIQCTSWIDAWRGFYLQAVSYFTFLLCRFSNIFLFRLSGLVKKKLYTFLLSFQINLSVVWEFFADNWTLSFIPYETANRAISKHQQYFRTFYSLLFKTLLIAELILFSSILCMAALGCFIYSHQCNTP